MRVSQGDGPMLAAIGVALLAQGDRLDRLSRLLTMLAIIGIAWFSEGEASVVSVSLCAVATAAGVAEIYVALRVGLDAELFGMLAREDGPDAPDLARLDRGLQACGLIAGGSEHRSLTPRIAGARRLLMLQGLALALQITLLATAGAVQ